MPVIFINNSRSLNGHGIAHYEQNPGIGGTEYVTLKILYELAKRNSNIDFKLLSKQKLSTDHGLPNVSIIKDLENVDKATIICPMSQLNFFKDHNKEKFNLLIWSHHPHDEHVPKHYASWKLISLGEYQFLSNKKLNNKHFLIPNPFPKPQVKSKLTRIDESIPKNFVYIGAIGPAKGLHKVIESWAQFSSTFPDAELNIIGGDLYQEGNSEPGTTIPVGGLYGKKLRSVMDKLPTAQQKKIIFHGILDATAVRKILINSDVALLNPTGKSEAAPASPLECFSYGIPVVAGGDFGAFDVMAKFPELDLITKSLPQVSATLSNPQTFSSLKERAYKISQQNYEHNGHIYQQWIDLINSKLVITDITGFDSLMARKILKRELIYRRLKYPLRKIKNFLQSIL